MNSSEQAIEPRNGVLLLSGYAIKVAVERGHLAIGDGVGVARRQARLPRADRDLRRLVVLGHSGTISFDALRWLSDIGVSFIQIDSDANVIAATGPAGLRDARLRRAQALAWGSEVGLTAAKSLVIDKIAGQRALLGQLPTVEGAEQVLDSAIKRIPDAVDVNRLRFIEAEAALAYWKSWSTVTVKFARRNSKSIPKHWKTFGRRASLVTGRSRKASNPANAILNYLYAIAEAEATVAAIAVGCDPGLGVLHADERSRDSLACDLMEPVRPKVDGFLIDLMESRIFRKQDFFETREGVCRLMPPLTNLLAETGPRWAAAVAPHAEQFARQIMTGPGAGSKVRSQPTPLTQANRSAGRKKSPSKSAAKPRKTGKALPRTCTVCGANLKRGRIEYCSDCKPVQIRDAVSKAHSALRKQREAGGDPAHGGEAAKRRGKRISETNRAIREWKKTAPGKFDPAIFASDIAPTLADIPLVELMKATGLSRPYCAMIRRSMRVPHPRHWEILRAFLTR